MRFFTFYRSFLKQNSYIALYIYEVNLNKDVKYLKNTRIWEQYCFKKVNLFSFT